MPVIEKMTGPRSRLDASTARALLTDAAAGEVLERVARLTALALRAPVAVLGMVDGDRLLVASEVGLPEPWRGARQLPLAATFCRHVAEAGDAFVVDDAARHPVAYSVARLENFARASYCGAPVVVADEVVAVLSVTDSQARRWTAEDVALVRDLAAAALRDLELLSASASVQAREVMPLNALPEGVLMLDAEWRITYVNSRAMALLRSEENVTGRVFWELYPTLVGTVFHHELLRVQSDRVSVDVEDFCQSLGRWLEVRGYPAEDGGAVVHLRDVSERRTAQEELRGREARYRRLFEDSRTPLFALSAEGCFVEANRALEELLGRSREELQRLHVTELAVDATHMAQQLGELREQGAAVDVEVELRRRDGSELTCLLSAGAHVQEDGTVYHGALRDITVQKKKQEALVRSALHDALTGLPNRVVFMDRLERLLKHSKRRSGYRFAVLFLDLDKFKQVNDTHGHHIGDQLLVAVARRLEQCVRQEDTVARIGGDEFAVLLDQVQDPSSVTLVVDRIRDSLGEPFSSEGREAGTTVSIGIALSVSGYDRAEDLLRDADSAMYRAKAAGRDGYVIFDADMHQRALAQRQLEHDLRDALTSEQLAVHYHPVVELDGGAVTGLEALIRWSHPERGILLPADFMPLAEQTGIIVDIGWWVLREACRQLRAWQLEYPGAAFSLTMSVNLSAKQFVHPELVTRIDAILTETGLDPHCLRLDLTEAVVMQNAALAAQLLGELRERGIQICIDDFGTGYSSLRELAGFPISTLKIDRSFIGQLDGRGHEVVQSIIALGRSMAIDAIAEGVETPEQLEQLRRLGTKFAQGFLFSLPLDRHETTALLVESS